MNGLSRAGKLIALASEINDVEVDAGSLAFMGQALVQTTLPHSDPGVPFFERTNGAVSLSIIANPRIGLPFGTVPRLLLAWICTEAVKTKSPMLGLGKSQNEFLRKLGMRTDGRDCQRLRAQSLKLFSSMLSITYQSHGRFGLKNMPIADEAFVLWDPHRPDDRMLWESTLKLSSEFFRNVTESPVPIDMRVLHALSKSPLAMDVYSWLVYRIFLLRVTNRPSVLIPWKSLKLQFGADYSDTPRGLLDFKKRFLQRLKEALLFYPEANVSAQDTGLLVVASRLRIRHTGGARLSSL
ncbi:MAG: repA [bacterium]|nr:MAG: repA [bacterium]KAF0150499.1 MAG: repA [bacterium]TXT32760.1 MAG: repA [Rhodocyclaceae bacterium]